MNLARRHLNSEQKRASIEDQLTETGPDKSLRWVGKACWAFITVTVASIRGELESLSERTNYPLTDEGGIDGQIYRATKPLRSFPGLEDERKSRIESVTLIHGDCRKELRRLLPAASIRSSPIQFTRRSSGLWPHH